MNIKYALLCTALIVLIAFYSAASIKISSNFESGSIGTIAVRNLNDFNLALRDDNLNHSLSDDWRSWWYIKAQGSPFSPNEINITLSNRGWRDFYPPVYSYDNKTWHRVSEAQVHQSEACNKGIKNCTLLFKQALLNKEIYLASFIPYTVTDLQHYLDKIYHHEAVRLEVLGYSPKLHLPIHHLIITDPKSNSQQARIWIHARTHPGETPSNFILEGLIDFLLSDDDLAIALRKQLIFHIVPMHNPDGVWVGNYRTNPHSINLEPAWFFNKQNPGKLTIDAPQENQLLNNVMEKLLHADIPVKIALNLHASHSEPETAFFAFPHFGADVARYNPEQINLWNKQLKFIDHLTRFYDYRVEAPEADDGSFLKDYYPETWWWFNTQDAVMAMTLEATYGKAGYDHWITDKEHRDVGPALAKTIASYLMIEGALPLPPENNARLLHDATPHNAEIE